MFRPTYKITLTCMALMILYGICQDMITVRISREYFTVAHDTREVPFEDPTLMAIGWGTRACGGPGAILGLVLAIIATIGSKPPLHLRDLWPGLSVYFVIMAWTTLICGLAGWWVACIGGIRLSGDWGLRIPQENVSGFVGVACAHLGAYAVGIIGGVGVGIWAGLKRGAIARHAESS